MESNKINLLDILNKYEKIIIPEIQRDYVMGSGGKKLESLFLAMNNSLQNGKTFPFSCIVGYEDKENKSLYVYDGQQRLATLIFLCSYLDKDNRNLFNKFKFVGREKANEWIANPENMNTSEIIDFTTYSLLELKNSFEEKWFKKTEGNGILVFLKKDVYFDMVLVDQVSDAEQFFLDINDGLDLKPYEIYKAALYHHASGRDILGESFKKFALKMENEWLEFFSQYRKFEWEYCVKSKCSLRKEKVCAEEVLIYFFKYCFRMMWIQNNGSDKEYIEDDVTKLTKENLEKIEKIIDAIVKKFSGEIGAKSEEKIINYSVDNKGAHWNITCRNYSEMLRKFLYNIWNIEETKKDIIVWCYISRFSDESNENRIDEYLRMIRKILNHNRFECKRADVFFEDRGVPAKKIVCARYYVRGIPKYYLNSRDENASYYKNDTSLDYENFLNEIIKNSEKNNLAEWKTTNALLSGIIVKEIFKKNSKDYCEIKEIENISFMNGIVDNFLEYDYENETCILRHQDIINQCKNLKLSDYQYKAILKFVCDNKLKIDNFLFNDITVWWSAYTGTKYSQKGKSLISHTWCDLFTINTAKELDMQNSVFVREDDDFRHKYFDLVPDGWFDGENIVQPEDGEYIKNGNGFAGWGKTNKVFNLVKITSNFDSIVLNDSRQLYVNRLKVEEMPKYLLNYNGKNWVGDKIKNQIVFYSEKPWLNDILLRLFCYDCESVNMDEYLKEYEGYMLSYKMYENQFFIKLHQFTTF